ncbi:Rap30/74 interaction domain-containing protein, partial [Metschnikowia bicuspidata]
SPPPQKPNAGEWNVIPLKACTKESLVDTRHHILKFHTKQDVDILKNFHKPVRMHRKDPQNIQFQLTRQQMDQKKRDALERGEDGGNGANADPEDPNAPVDMLQVAPDGGARRFRRNLFKRKTKQVRVMDEKKRQLRYEEYYPWVMEDYTGDNVFVGSYEAGSSESTHVLFVFDKNCFKMVPAEKVYKFTPRNKYATLTLEEAEARMEKNLSAPRWLMKHMDETNVNDSRFRRMNAAAVSRGPSQNISRMRTVQGGAYYKDSDHDELDFDEEFADDEEAPIMDGDEEENKLLEKKVKKEMLKAAHFDGQLDFEDDSDDLNDLFEVEKSRKVDKEGKKLKKVLTKTEGGIYESDNDEIASFVSQSDLETEEESDSEIAVKPEPNDGAVDDGLPRQSSIVVTSITDCVIVVRAPKSFLQTIPPGEWNPNVRKRQPSFESLGTVKKLKKENSMSPQPQPAATTSDDLNDAGPNNELVTTKEVLDIVRQNPLTTKELLLNLRSRISMHKDNKLRIITIVKLNLRLVDDKLVLR